MLRSIHRKGSGICLLLVIGGSEAGLAKGLKTLSEANPANNQGSAANPPENPTSQPTLPPASTAVEAGGAAEGMEKNKPEAGAVSQERSVVSKLLADKLQLSTSYGWITGSRISGDWTARGGTSDLTVAYQYMKFSPEFDGHLTYRYVPMSVTGDQKSQSYRGIWENHYVGIKVSNPKGRMVAFATLEAGYVATKVESVDGLPEQKNLQVGGVSGVVGGGIEFKVQDALSVGPKLAVGGGTIRTFQLALATNFLF